MSALGGFAVFSLAAQKCYVNAPVGSASDLGDSDPETHAYRERNRSQLDWSFRHFLRTEPALPLAAACHHGRGVRGCAAIFLPGQSLRPRLRVSRQFLDGSAQPVE